MAIASLVTLALPTRDLVAAARFYRDGFGLPCPAPVRSDSLPEPVAFVLNAGVQLMLIPTGGFGWVAGGHAVAAPGVSECLISLTVELPTGVDDLVERGRTAGGTVVSEATTHDRGYSGTFEDLDGHLWMVRAAPDA
jgi:uncharacterized protein